MSSISPGHRKTVKHYDDLGHVHELTFSCYQRTPLLLSDWRRRLLSRSIDRAIQRHTFRLIGFVYMPEHVHLLVYPEPIESRIDRLLYAIKRPFSVRVKARLEQTNDRLLDELTIRERPGKTSFRFWQEGPGYDRNLISLERVVSAIDYFHENPLRRGLCEQPDEWKWSSYRYYHFPEAPPDLDLPTVHGLPDWID